MAIQQPARRNGSASTRPRTPEEQARIREQVERIAGSSWFLHSRRYPAFLRYVVEQTLLGASHDDLKERTLGVTVFKRPADYDTSADPVVRNTASEVRKRLEEYYSELEHRSELRILLPVGTYVPEFSAAGDADVAAASEASRAVENPGAAAAVHAQRPPLSRRAMLYAALGLALVGAVVTTVMLVRPKPAIERFWLPVLEGRESVLIVTETLITASLPRTDATRLSGSSPEVAEVDANLFLSVNEATAKLAAFVTAHGRTQELDLARNVSLSRLRRGPAVLVGAFNNPWTIRATDPLRFHFQLDRETLVRRIIDRQDPSRLEWVAPMRPGLREDYALVVRGRSADTGQEFVVIAGLGERGTAAAIEVTTNPTALDRMVSQLPTGWSRRNLELVIRTRFVNEEWGAPELLAFHVWD